MKRNLKTIANQLSEEDIKEIMQYKKTGDKKTVALQKKRDKLAADLAKIEVQLARALGEPAPKARRGRKPAVKKAAPAKTSSPAKSKGRKKSAAGSRRRANITGAVREIIGEANGPVRARDIVEALPAKGVKVKDVADMRKRISVVLASQKNSFEQVSRGMYQLKG